MTVEEVEKEMDENIKREDGRYKVDGGWLSKMNTAGIYFSFKPEGVRWQRDKFL